MLKLEFSNISSSHKIGICVLCSTLRNSQRSLQFAPSLLTGTVSGCWVGIQERGAMLWKGSEGGLMAFLLLSNTLPAHLAVEQDSSISFLEYTRKVQD